MLCACASLSLEKEAGVPLVARALYHPIIFHRLRGRTADGRVQDAQVTVLLVQT